MVRDGMTVTEPVDIKTGKPMVVGFRDGATQDREELGLRFRRMPASGFAALNGTRMGRAEEVAFLTEAVCRGLADAAAQERLLGLMTEDDQKHGFPTSPPRKPHRLP